MVAQIVEHISMVDEGAGKLCSRLLRKARAAGGALLMARLGYLPCIHRKGDGLGTEPGWRPLKRCSRALAALSRNHSQTIDGTLPKFV